MKHPILFLAALVGIASCDAQVESRKEAIPAAEAPAAVVQAADPLVAAGPAVTVQAETEDSVQWAASVVRLDPLTRQRGDTTKLFGASGGDPAMNGLYTYVAFFRSASEGWAVFRVGDVLDYRVLSEAPGRVDLEIEESVLDEQTTRISSRKRRVIVSWTLGADDAPPSAVTVTPAR